jgi:hypothetical protein
MYTSHVSSCGYSVNFRKYIGNFLDTLHWGVGGKGRRKDREDGTRVSSDAQLGDYDGRMKVLICLSGLPGCVPGCVVYCTARPTDDAWTVLCYVCA